jgi:hypothetical protein
MTETTTTIRPYQGAVDTYPPSIPPSNHSIVPDSGYFGNTWPANGSIPSSFSSAGWTMQARGFQQQTFLGASIRSFSMNGGFGDSSSTLSVELVNDEFNQSDKTPAGFGDDVYHSGLYDLFAPPPVGSPVFFKFGQNLATVEEAYRKTFDDLYDYDTLPDNNIPTEGTTFDPINFPSLADNTFVDLQLSTSGQYINLSSYLSSPSKGEHHLVFGGILQSYTQNRGPGGDPLYSVQVIDPREILANTILILNNYAGTIYNNKNIFI